jgi:outer membrane murein-binding lipoprotein Lpp
MTLRPLPLCLCPVLLAAFALAGCGSSESPKAATAAVERDNRRVDAELDATEARAETAAGAAKARGKARADAAMAGFEASEKARTNDD